MATGLNQNMTMIELHSIDTNLTTATSGIVAERILQSQQTSTKRFSIVIYPTVKPETIIVPIVSCIVCFPVLAFLVICCLRRRAKLSRERARRRNCELGLGDVSIARMSPGSRSRSRALSRSSRGRTSVDLDTVQEERSDAEHTTVELMTPDKDAHLMSQLMALQEMKNSGS